MPYPEMPSVLDAAQMTNAASSKSSTIITSGSGEANASVMTDGGTGTTIHNYPMRVVTDTGSQPKSSRRSSVNKKDRQMLENINNAVSSISDNSISKTTFYWICGGLALISYIIFDHFTDRISEERDLANTAHTQLQAAIDKSNEKLQQSLNNIALDIKDSNKDLRAELSEIKTDIHELDKKVVKLSSTNKSGE